MLFRSSQSSGDIDSNIYNYCYIGDGNSHPLSSVTSCAGTNTTGWTLAQWQAKFSFVDSLTNEVDWVAIQAFFNKYAFKPSFLQLPVGTAVINKPVVTCGQVHIQGAGEKYQTSIKATAANQDFLRVCLSSDYPTLSPSNYRPTLQINDISIDCAVTGGSNCNYAVRYSGRDSKIGRAHV